MQTEPDRSGFGRAAAFGGMFLAWYVGLAVLVGVVGGGEFIASTPGLCLLVTGTGAGGLWLGDRFGRWQDWTPAETWGLAAGPPQSRIWAAATLGGLTLGVVGGWLAENVGQPLKQAMHWPQDVDTMTSLASALTEGPLGWRALFILVVVFVGPLFEELIFRGVLWRSLRARGAVTSILVTSLAFALYHGDPAQAIGLLPLALLLGVLRRAGAIAPCVLAHALNNAVATLLALTLGLDGETSVALATGAAACGALAFGLALSAGQSAEPGPRVR